MPSASGAAASHTAPAAPASALRMNRPSAALSGGAHQPAFAAMLVATAPGWQHVTVTLLCGRGGRRENSTAVRATPHAGRTTPAALRSSASWRMNSRLASLLCPYATGGEKRC